MEQFTDLIAVSVVRTDGGVSIVRLPVRASQQCYDTVTAERMGFILSDGVWSREISDDAVEEYLASVGLGDRSSWRRIEESDVPDRGPGGVFRNAMRDDGKEFSHDMDAAREIVRNEIRAKRDFAPLDAEIAKLSAKAAIGALTDDEKAGIAEVEAERQKLRDAPADPAIDAAKSIAELAALIDGQK